jgi:hypothetical protein
MSIKYDGKSPSKLWYFWQNTKAMMRTPFEYSTQKDAKKAGKDLGIFVGAAAVTQGVLSIGMIAALPLAPTLISLVGFSVAITYGWQGFQKMRALKSSSFVYGYVREKENQWLHKKADGNALQRGLKSVKDKIKNFGASIPLPLVKAGKWIGAGLAAAGAAVGIGAGLSYAGVPAFSTGAAATSILGGIAHAGAVVGLSAAAAVATVTGIAVAAIPVGIAATVWCRKNAYARNPDRPVFKKPPSGGQPIDRGQVFTPKAKAASFEFNTSSNTAEPTNNNSSDLSEERKRAAEARQSRKRFSNNRFN